MYSIYSNQTIQSLYLNQTPIHHTLVHKATSPRSLISTAICARFAASATRLKSLKNGDEAVASAGPPLATSAPYTYASSCCCCCCCCCDCFDAAGVGSSAAAAAAKDWGCRCACAMEARGRGGGKKNAWLCWCAEGEGSGVAVDRKALPEEEAMWRE